MPKKSFFKIENIKKYRKCPALQFVHEVEIFNLTCENFLLQRLKGLEMSVEEFTL